MAVRLGTQPVFRRALRALRLYPEPTGSPPGAAAGLRSVCSGAPEETQRATLESTEEYRFVERLIPPSRVPGPPQHAGPCPSGWTPPADPPPALPYMVRRSRMHNIPVYTDRSSGSRRTTLVRRVEGDIWALQRDVTRHLQQRTGKELPTQVNEVTMTLKVKGHVDAELKTWLASKGF